MLNPPLARQAASLPPATASLEARLPAAGQSGGHDGDLIGRTQRRYRERARARRWTIMLGQLGLLVLFLGLWELASGRIMDARAVSNPVAVFAALGKMISTGDLWPDLWQTLMEILSGFAIGSVLALGLAFAFALAPSAQAVLRPFLLGFYSIPKIALAPLIVMWFGLGTTPKIVLAATFVFFIVFMNAAGGVDAVERGHVMILRIMGAGRFAIFRKVVLPSTLPFLLTGFRLAIPEAITGCVIGEFITSDVGLGHRISVASSELNTAVSLAAVVVLLVIVAIADMLLTLIETHLMRWKPAAKARATH